MTAAIDRYFLSMTKMRVAGTIDRRRPEDTHTYTWTIMNQTHTPIPIFSMSLRARGLYMPLRELRFRREGKKESSRSLFRTNTFFCPRNLFVFSSSVFYDPRSIFGVKPLLLPALRRLGGRAPGTGLDRTLDLALPMAIVDLNPTMGIPAE